MSKIWRSRPITLTGKDESLLEFLLEIYCWRICILRKDSLDQDFNSRYDERCAKFLHDSLLDIPFTYHIYASCIQEKNCAVRVKPYRPKFLLSKFLHVIIQKRNWILQMNGDSFLRYLLTNVPAVGN